MSNKKCIFGVTDSTYLKQYAVCLGSILENATRRDFDVKILAVDCDVESEDLLAHYLRTKFGVSVEIIHMTEQQQQRFDSYDAVQSKYHLSKTALCKIYGFELLREHGYSSAMYVDPDLLAIKNIDELIIMLETVEVFAAVCERTRDITFNSGLMIANLEKTDEAFAKYDSLIMSNKFLTSDNLSDQLVFNDMFKTFEKIDFKFNSTMKDDLTASILHFVGYNKPWRVKNCAIDNRIRAYIEYVIKNTNSYFEFNLNILP